MYRSKESDVGFNFNSLYKLVTNSSKPSGYYVYHQFNIQKFYVLPTQCLYVFCVDLSTNDHYFPIQY